MKIKLSFAIPLLLSLLVFSCSNEDIEGDQMTALRNYIRGNSVKDHYQVDSLGIMYRVIVNADREDRIQQPMVTLGDSLYYYFDVRLFNTGTNQPVIFTNKPSVIDSLVNAGLNATYWNRDMEGVRVGGTPLPTGVTLGLQGCYEGDQAWLFIPSKYAYDDKNNGMVPENTAIIFVADIRRVIKN